MKIKYYLNMNYKVYFKNHKNKIFAVGFSALANIIFFAYALYVLIGARGSLSFSSVWNYLLYAVSYLIILIANIRNDNFAYQGILMFVFFMAFDQVYTLIINSVNVINAFSSGNVIYICLFLLFFLFLLAEAVTGIILYININRYMRGSIDDFKKVRIPGILYSCFLVAGLAFHISLSLILPPYGTLVALFMFIIPISEMIMSIAICFTLERLRRI